MITLLIATVTTLALLGLAPALYLAGTAVSPPRHARPKNYQGPANRAPLPLVAGEIDDEVAISARLIEKFGPPLSPLSTDVLRNMFRRDMAEKHGRRLV